MKRIKNYLIKLYRTVIQLRDWGVYTLRVLPRPKYSKKYNIIICGIFKNEARFLKEWIEYHELVGVEHFYLYNNNSTDNYKEVLEEYINRGIVTLIEWPIEQGQIQAYKHFSDNYWNESQWVSFLDIDEFYVPKKDKTLLEWIKRNDKFPVLLVYWKMFGTSGHSIHDDTKLCIEQYINSWENLVRCGKCLINTDYKISDFDASTHHRTNVTYERLPIKLHPVDSLHHVVIKDPEILLKDTQTKKSEIQINHYWSKGWDVYDRKRSYSGDVFFKRNPKSNINYFTKNELRNTSIDVTIQKYLLMLKWKINHSKEYDEIVEESQKVKVTETV